MSMGDRRECAGAAHIGLQFVLDGFRWLTVGPKDQPDLALLLAYPAPPMFSPEDAETVRALVAKGALGGGAVTIWAMSGIELVLA